jgi:hypothetical protein
MDVADPIDLMEVAADAEQILFVPCRTLLALGSCLSSTQCIQIVDAESSHRAHRCFMQVVAKRVDIVSHTPVQGPPVVARTLLTIGGGLDVAAQVRQFSLAARLASRVNVVAEAVGNRHRAPHCSKIFPVFPRTLVAMHTSLASAQVVQVLSACLILRWRCSLRCSCVGSVLAEVVDFVERAAAFSERRPVVPGAVITVHPDLFGT